MSRAEDTNIDTNEQVLGDQVGCVVETSHNIRENFRGLTFLEVLISKNIMLCHLLRCRQARGVHTVYAEENKLENLWNGLIVGAIVSPRT